jgi:hypothetical protein
METMQLYKQFYKIIKVKAAACTIASVEALNYWDIVKILNQDKFMDADTLPLKV